MEFKISRVEFIALLASCICLIALSTDTMLPALPEIASYFGLDQGNAQQYMITFLFLGLALGQLIAGPLSDSIGRKKAIYGGLTLFIIGCIISYFAPTYEIMLAARFLQGIGGAFPRVIANAIIRDRYQGRDMAQIMSFVMTVFILVPALAPAIGQGIIALAGWHAIFLLFIAVASLVFIWMATRLPETLKPEDQRAFTASAILKGMKLVISNKVTMCYAMAAGFVFGAMIGYLNSSQQIFQDYYQSGDLFALYFGMIALSLGAASMTNAKLVKTFGMRYLVLRSLIAMAIFAAIFIIVEIAIYSTIPLLVFMVYILCSSFCIGMLFGNFNALAMEPMGHMAGIASAVIGSLSMIISLTCGGVIGQLYNDTLLPLSIGFLVLSCASLAMMGFAEYHEKKSTL